MKYTRFDTAINLIVSKFEATQGFSLAKIPAEARYQKLPLVSESDAAATYSIAEGCTMTVDDAANMTDAIVTFDDGTTKATYAPVRCTTALKLASVGRVIDGTAYTVWIANGADVYSESVNISGIEFVFERQRRLRSTINPATMLGKLGIGEPIWTAAKLVTLEMVRVINAVTSASMATHIVAIEFSGVQTCKMSGVQYLTFHINCHQLCYDSGPIVASRNKDRTLSVTFRSALAQQRYDAVVFILTPLINYFV